MRDINKIIIHCSASNFGDAAVIDAWHKERGWRGIGYHFVILNGHASSQSGYDKALDGVIEKGRAIEEIGAHCKGHNRNSIGICLIGNARFSDKQLKSVMELTQKLKVEYQTVKDIHGHCEFNSHKTCPNMPFFIEKVLKNKGDI